MILYLVAHAGLYLRIATRIGDPVALSQRLSGAPEILLPKAIPHIMSMLAWWQLIDRIERD